MNRTLFIYGAGGLGREIRAMLRSIPDWEMGGYFDDRLERSSWCDGAQCLGGLEDLLSVERPIQLILAFGLPETKYKVEQRLRQNENILFPTLIHPRATLLDESSITIGEGCLITAGCVLTTHISIGKHTLINLNSTIGHDTKLGSFCSLMPGTNLAGGVTTGDRVLIGSGANVLNRVSIGEGACVGAGAVVTRAVKSGTTVVGVPAKEMRKV